MPNLRNPMKILPYGNNKLSTSHWVGLVIIKVQSYWHLHIRFESAYFNSDLIQIPFVISICPI